MPSPAVFSEAPTPQGPFPPGALCGAPIVGTTSPSDSRSPPCAFAFGLYARPSPDVGRGDGSLVFRSLPSTRAAPSTPPELPTHPDSRVRCVAFAGTCAARLPDCFSVEAAGFTSCCRPRTCSPSRTSNSSSCVQGCDWGRLPGLPAPAWTGLAPAGSSKRESRRRPRGLWLDSSGRTMPASLAAR